MKTIINRSTRLLRLSILASAAVVVTATSLLVPFQPAAALNGTDFSAGHIIDDAIFTNSNAMSAQDIQNFLNAKQPSCDTSGSVTASYWWDSSNGYVGRYRETDGNGNLTYTDSYVSTSRAIYGQRYDTYRNTTIAAAPYVCINSYVENPTTHANNLQNPGATISGGLSAAQIIYNTAQTYHINPQVILTTLQKEQGLITDDWPWTNEYSAAMGYACPDDGTGCHSKYAGFFTQVDAAAWQFRHDLNSPSTGNYIPGQNNYIGYYPCSNGTTVYIQNAATAVLYNYTPYQPDPTVIQYTNPTGSSNGPGAAPSSDGCATYGNRNFWWYFNTWFGSTYAFIYKGVNYSNVFDPVYYLNNNPDVQQATGGDQLGAFDHFINHGMSEGRQGSANFNVTTYRNRYPDLRWVFGTSLPDYYRHFITNGQAEGRYATGTATLQPVTTYGGINYTNVYDFPTYLANNSDLSSKYSNDDTGALVHFVNYGMNEGRQANANFSVQSYRARYYDLRRVFGDNLKAYYMHFITNGKAESRVATGSYVGGTTVYKNVDYSAVYNLNDYEAYNSDIQKTYGLDDQGALQHFVNYGMNEGRQASTAFNVYTYKSRYPDLQAAFGNNLKAYYMHFITNGKAEGRSGA